MAGQQLIIVGAGALSREVICWIHGARAQGWDARIKGHIVDPQFDKLPAHYHAPWLGGLSDYRPQADEACVVAISDPHTKSIVVARLRAQGARFASVIHPSAVVAHTATLGEACLLCPHTMVSADTIVGNFVTVNAHTSIGHDARIGDFSNLSAHVDITGYVQVGEACFFGSGARVLPKLKIGARAKIGAGAVVMRSVPDDATVYTDPAKRLR